MELGLGDGTSVKTLERSNTVCLIFPPELSNRNAVLAEWAQGRQDFLEFFLETSLRDEIFLRLIAFGNRSPAFRNCNFYVRLPVLAIEKSVTLRQERHVCC
jgi:hypothetical protein